MGCAMVESQQQDGLNNGCEQHQTEKKKKWNTDTTTRWDKLSKMSHLIKLDESVAKGISSLPVSDDFATADILFTNQSSPMLSCLLDARTNTSWVYIFIKHTSQCKTCMIHSAGTRGLHARSGCSMTPDNEAKAREDDLQVSVGCNWVQTANEEYVLRGFRIHRG